MRAGDAPEPGDTFVHRAKFSAVSKESTERAMRTLRAPTATRRRRRRQAGARPQGWRGVYQVPKPGSLQGRTRTWMLCHLVRPVSDPGTLNFAERHLETVSHTPEDFWSLHVEVRSASLGKTLVTRYGSVRECSTPTSERCFGPWSRGPTRVGRIGGGNGGVREGPRV